jgi:ParE toxin of type II toxin-antitoxin system, parDE
MMEDAYVWYEKQRDGLGEEFFKELDLFFNKIRLHPEHFSKIKRSIRQAALKRFPYVIVFELIKTEVVVFAVFHTKRSPGTKFR